MTADSAKKRVLSGIQPTGSLHLGNYLGAIRQWVRGQGVKDNYICIVDLHAVTVYQPPEELRHNVRSLAAMLIACGIDVERTHLFVQSHVRAHAEAAWFLSCITPLGQLERMTQYKDKSKKQESIQTGLLTYPVLQAADILLYDPHEVPVGEDQKQHIELTRDIAQKFNHVYGDTFIIPDAVIPKAGARIMGFDDPTAKMSKSALARGHAVRLTDTDKEIERTIKRSVTDSGNEIAWSDDPAKAGVVNLLEVYRAITDSTPEQSVAAFADARGYGDLKKRVAEVVVEEIRPIRERYEQLMSDTAELDRQLEIGAQGARARAEPKVIQIKEAMGFSVPDALKP